MTENLELTATYLCIVGKSPEMKKVFLDKNGYHYDFPTPEIAYNLLKSENKHIKTDLRNVKAKSNCCDIHIERVQIWFSSERDNKHKPNLKYGYGQFCKFYEGRKGNVQSLIERGLLQSKRKLAQGCLDEYERRISETYIYHAKRYLKENFYQKNGKFMIIALKNKFTDEIFVCNEIKFDEVANQDVFYGICISEKHKDVFDRRITHQEYLCSWEEVAKNELLNYKNLNK